MRLLTETSESAAAAADELSGDGSEARDKSSVRFEGFQGGWFVLVANLQAHGHKGSSTLSVGPDSMIP